MECGDMKVMKKKKWIIAATVMALIQQPTNLYAQCCGAGNPVSSAGSEVSVNRGNMQISLDYRHSESNKYYEGSHLSDIDFPGRLHASGYDYMALGIGCGITSRLTVQVSLGYFIDKYEKYDSDMFPDVSASGIGDLSLSLNYAVYRHVRKGITVNPYVMVKFPVGKFDCVSDGVKLPISMQPSSGSYKYTVGVFATYSPIRKLSLQTNVFGEYAQRIESHNFDYKYGNMTYASFGVQYSFIPQLSAGVSGAYEHKGRAKDKNITVYGTMFDQLKVTPMLTYSPFHQFRLSALADIPVWRKAEGIQMANTWAIELKATYNIKLY